MMERIFDLLPLWFGILAGGVVAMQVTTSISKRIRRAHGLRKAQLGRVAQASKALREKVKVTLDLRREERQMEVELIALDRSIAEGEAQAEREKRTESQIYVFDERKNTGDQAFLFTITHPDFNNLARNAPPEICTSWRSGRRYMVWAASEKMAAAKANMRFNQDKGYRVSPPQAVEGDMEEY